MSTYDAFFLIGGLMVAAGAFLALVQPGRRLRHRLVDTLGVVIDPRTGGDGHGSPHQGRRPLVRFTDDSGHEHRGRGATPEPRGWVRRAGQPIAVRYDRDDPGWWTTARGAQPGVGAALDGVVLILLGLVVAVFARSVVDLIVFLVR